MIICIIFLLNICTYLFFEYLLHNCVDTLKLFQWCRRILYSLTLSIKISSCFVILLLSVQMICCEKVFITIIISFTLWIILWEISTLHFGLLYYLFHCFLIINFRYDTCCLFWYIFWNWLKLTASVVLILTVSEIWLLFRWWWVYINFTIPKHRFPLSVWVQWGDSRLPIISILSYSSC